MKQEITKSIEEAEKELREKQIEEMARVMNECCNRYDENGNHIGNKCYECEEWSSDNYCCCSYNTKEATALYNADYRKQEWIDVNERLPETDDFYLCISYCGCHEIYWFNRKHKLFNASDDSTEWAIDVTHWMPLPTPPKMKGAE